MPFYNVTLTASANTVVTVEAPGPAEALAAAKEADTPTLCHQCASGRHGSPELTIGDAWDLPDGNPGDFITEISD